MAKVPHGIWKNSPELSFAPKCAYFGIGNDKVTYHIERVTNNPLYKWVAKNPKDSSKFFFGKTLDEIKRKLDLISKLSDSTATHIGAIPTNFYFCV